MVESNDAWLYTLHELVATRTTSESSKEIPPCFRGANAKPARPKPPSLMKSRREGPICIEKIVLESVGGQSWAGLPRWYNAHVQPTEGDELRLIQRISEGDEGAFLQVYDQYAPRVYSLALHILSDSMLAEEATQDTFVKLWSRARTYVPARGSFAVWLLTIARRTCLDRLRLERRRPVLSDGQDPEEAWRGVTNKNIDPAEARWRSLRFAVTALPNEQRKVIELAYYQGMSQSEIAAELDWPLGTVKTRMRTAMQTLRQAWMSEDRD